jgi:transaldolase
MTATAPRSRLAALAAVGTSVWVDGLVAPDELARLIREDGVTGLTSNPTIFRAALLGQPRYVDRIAAVAGQEPGVAYEALALEDVRAAADTLAGVFDRTGGRDGFVSLEVAPELAHDTPGTVAAARQLWTRIGRRDAMIKIPATPAGMPAIRRAIAEGINVNVTLLFSVDAYSAVADAYISGLEDRLARGQRVDGIASVASFFVSRVDTAVDALLTARGREDLTGRAAVANAQAAYARYRDLFGGDRFARLAAAGAAAQRPLWASTATKDARYSDVKYVEELAGPGVVSTMPPATLAAFREHGIASDRLSGARAAAADTLAGLAEAGIDLPAVTRRLLDEGVAAFQQSMRELVDGLASLTRKETS